MNEETSVVKFEGENGDTFEMIILKEFAYKDKNYVILMDDECGCDNDCKCGCHEDKECDCHDEKGIYILEVTKDKDGNEMFKAIEDEKFLDEVIKHADKILYED